MSRVYDNWARLVDAVLKRELYRQLALAPSFDSSISDDFSSVCSIDSSAHDFDGLFRSDIRLCDLVNRIIEKPIQLADQVIKSAASASSFKQECSDLKSKSEKLAGLLRQVARSTNDLPYETPTRLIISHTELVLDKALSLVLRCQGNIIVRRMFNIITPTAAFRKMSWGIERSADDVSWLLHMSKPSRVKSSHGSVYVWGEVVCDSVIKIGPEKNTSGSSTTTRTDILVPKPLDCNMVHDVGNISCGVRHAALVTRQGELFAWGEDSGGRLGHGFGKDATQPRLVESLSLTTVESVSCGEFHMCAVTVNGELYTCGDGAHHAGLLGHGGTDIIHWVPKRVLGQLDGLHVAAVTCGPWHTALITSSGRLFTFGDGTFGVLGHGSGESFSYPKEVEALLGLRTITVACGVWHTAAVVVNPASASSGKLFTWGDGDRNRLGQGDKDSRLKPTCVPTLIDYNFSKIACGHSLTVALTTSGRVFTMGSAVYGQLGNPNIDGKQQPCSVDEKLADEHVEEISCGAYHVAVLTSRNEVYTWGKGANGRLGHGDIEDRKTPCLVEALKDRTVKSIACGSNYTAAICIHKWVYGDNASYGSRSPYYAPDWSTTGETLPKPSCPLPETTIGTRS